MKCTTVSDYFTIVAALASTDAEFSIDVAWKPWGGSSTLLTSGLSTFMQR